VYYPELPARETSFVVPPLLRVGSDHDWISRITRSMYGYAVAVAVVVWRVDLDVSRVYDVRHVRDPGREDGKAQCER
jgi:hypothetical protein